MWQLSHVLNESVSVAIDIRMRFLELSTIAQKGVQVRKFCTRDKYSDSPVSEFSMAPISTCANAPSHDTVWLGPRKHCTITLPRCRR